MPAVLKRATHAGPVSLLLARIVWVDNILHDVDMVLGRGENITKKIFNARERQRKKVIGMMGGVGHVLVEDERS